MLNCSTPLDKRIPILYITAPTAAYWSLCSLYPATNQRATTFFTQMKNQSYTLQISPFDQSPSCHSEECKTTTFVMPNITDYPDIGLRTVPTVRMPKAQSLSNTYCQEFGHLFPWSLL
ncbi:hypothetical protein TNCV_291241 [Trichonephila clavipes]|nr:hypothetical protein TNCV_291241 [Trichonephila clavipes]